MKKLLFKMGCQIGFIIILKVIYFKRASVAINVFAKFKKYIYLYIGLPVRIGTGPIVPRFRNVESKIKINKYKI